MGSKLTKFLSVFLLVVVLLLPFSTLLVSADSGRVFTMPLNQPSVDAGRGYLEYVVEDSSYGFTPVTLFWQIYPRDPSKSLFNTRVHVNISGTNGLMITPQFIDGYTDFMFYYCAVWGNGKTTYYSQDFSTGPAYVQINLASGYKFYGFKGYGNIGEITYNLNYYPTQEFSFVYAQDAPEYELLLEEYQLLNSIYNLLYTIDSDLADLSYLDTLSSLKTIIQSISTNVMQINSNVSTISTTLTTVNTKLTTIQSHLNSIKNNTDQLESYLDQVESYIDTIEPSLLNMITLLSNIDLNTDDIEPLLEEIIDILNQSFEEDPQPIPSGDAESQMGQMDEFVGGSNSQKVQSDINSSLSGSSLNGGLSSNASGLLWDILQRFLDGAPKIFAMLISLLSYGLISLLLGR